MTLVIDASALVALLLDDGLHGRWVSEYFADSGSNPSDKKTLCAPQLILIEVASSLRRLEHQRRASSTAISSMHQDLLSMPVTLYDHRSLAERAWALRHTVSSYDATYVALAETLQCPLLTLDRKLLAANGPRCEFASPPP